MARGARANRRGKILENAVNELLSEGYEEISAGRFFAMRELGQPIYARQCNTGKNIYGKQRFVDFILYHPRRWPDCLVLQCKWQTSSGSADEKYPFEVLSIQMGAFPTIIVLDGGGYSEGSATWLRQQAGKTRLIDVLSLAELNRWQSRGRL